MKGILALTTFMESENTLELMEGFIWALGKIIKCMDKATLLGLMEENTVGSTLMIKNKGLEFSCGLMERNTKVNGLTENNMEKENFTTHQMNRLKGFG